MTIFIRVCRFVDKDLSRSGYVRLAPWSIALACATVALPVPFLSHPYGVGEVVIIGLAAGLCLGWLTFVGWRGLRLIKAASLRADRTFDRTGKFELPTDHASTESSTAASRRRRGRDYP